MPSQSSVPEPPRYPIRKGSGAVVAAAAARATEIASKRFMALLRFHAGQRGSRQHSAEPHGLHRGGWHNHHRALLLDGLIEHVHGAEMQRHGVVLVGERRLAEHLGLLGFAAIVV